MNRLFSGLAVSLVLSASVLAHDHVVLIRGELMVGSLDSAIADYVFLSDSDVGDVILASCKVREVCEVRGYLDDDFIVEVVSAQRVFDDFTPPAGNIRGK